jgi:hypothetical protein
MTNQFNSDELDLLRQWFNNIKDVNGGYLIQADFDLMEKIATLQSGIGPQTLPAKCPKEAVGIAGAAIGEQDGDCTEPNREDCPRHCVEFCNEAETRKANTAPLPDNLLNELDWCIANGNVGPRSRKLLVSLRAALSRPNAPVEQGEREAFVAWFKQVYEREPDEFSIADGGKRHAWKAACEWQARASRQAVTSQSDKDHLAEPLGEGSAPVSEVCDKCGYVAPPGAKIIKCWTRHDADKGAEQ